MIEQIRVGGMANFTYIIADKDEAMIIDPSWDLEKVLDIIESNNLTLKYIVNTHSHFDHVFGNEQLKEITGAKIAMHHNSLLEKDIALDEGSILDVGDLKVRVLYTPGHSKDSISLLVDKMLFTGDLLFVGSCGRTDLEGGSAAELYDSLQRVASLGDDIIIYPGHDYGSKSYSTIGYEKEHNMVYKIDNKERFIEFMNE